MKMYIERHTWGGGTVVERAQFCSYLELDNLRRCVEKRTVWILRKQKKYWKSPSELGTVVPQSQGLGQTGNPGCQNEQKSPLCGCSEHTGHLSTPDTPNRFLNLRIPFPHNILEIFDTLVLLRAPKSSLTCEFPRSKRPSRLEPTPHLPVLLRSRNAVSVTPDALLDSFW